MIQLTQSPVNFSENPHGYRLGDKRLSGITSLIHEILQLGVYPDASEYVKTVAIPRAGEYGSSVHKAIETYDEIGIKQTYYEGDKFGPFDVSSELDNYIKHRQGYTPVANEYTVSDNEKWASNIDNVWQKVETQGIWLVDTKTNNLDYYPGGPDALKEYLSWQLSIYAELFERQNPTLKIEGLACNWLRKENAEFWEIERKPSEQVLLLLEATYMIDDFGKFHYFHANADSLISTALVPQTNNNALISQHLVQLIAQVQRDYEEKKTMLDEMKALLRQKMEENDIKSWESSLFKATIAKDSVSVSFNTTLFKKENPELYAKYSEEKVKKGGFTIKLKDV